MREKEKERERKKERKREREKERKKERERERKEQKSASLLVESSKYRVFFFLDPQTIPCATDDRVTQKLPDVTKKIWSLVKYSFSEVE